MADIYCFGDSITWGAWDDNGGWADRLKQDFHILKLQDINKPGIQVVNLGVSGDTAGDVAFRIEQEIKVRQKRRSSPSDIFIVAVGVNDSRIKDRQPISSPENYQQKLETISKIVKKTSRNLLFIGLTPVIDEIFTRPHEESYINKRVELFNKTLQQFCEDNNYKFIDIYDKISGLDLERLFPDGLHPNTEGHEWMYNQIKPEVLKILEEE